jgi:hypothetical protein
MAMTTTENETRLANRDYVLVIDKSGSMATEDVNGKSRWEAAKESTIAIARKISKYDPDGITVYTFNSGFKKFENVTPEKVEEIFSKEEPMGGTSLGPVLGDVFADYSKRKKAGNTKANGEMLLVVTDGEASDDKVAAKAIVSFGNGLENADEEYGISFVQIGKDAAASKFLKKLDDDLTSQGAKYDIVDTKTFEEVESIGLEQTLIAALQD